MTIEDAQRVLLDNALPGTIEEASWTPLNEYQGIAKVSMGEDAFYALLDVRVSWFPVFVLEESSLPGLLDWCLKMAAK